MDENVLNFVKQYIGDAIANYPKIPASKLNEVVEDASIRMVESLKTAVTTDKKDGIEALLNGSDDLMMANEVRKMLESDLVISIEEVTKLDAREATKVASSVFPVVLKRFCEAFDAESLTYLLVREYKKNGVLVGSFTCILGGMFR